MVVLLQISSRLGQKYDISLKSEFDRMQQDKKILRCWRKFRRTAYPGLISKEITS